MPVSTSRRWGQVFRNFFFYLLPHRPILRKAIPKYASPWTLNTTKMIENGCCAARVHGDICLNTSKKSCYA